MKIRHRDSPKIAKKVFTAKAFPICFLANSINGIFKINIDSETDKGVRIEISKEIPVIPPSINPAGIKKPFNPKPAVKMPRIIKKISFKNEKLKLNLFFITRNCIINL